MGERDNRFLVLDIEDGQDITDKEKLLRWIGDFKPHIIFHLASILGTTETFDLSPERVLAVNVFGTINMLEIARKYDARFIYSGLQRIWHNPYCISKGCGEDYVIMYHKHYGLETVILILADVYGPGQRTKPYKKIIPTFAIAALQGKPLTVFGTGSQTVDLTYIDDAANALILATESSKAVGQRIEIGTGIETTVNRVAKMIICLTCSKSEIQHGPWRRGEDPETHMKMDVFKAKQLLGFKADVPLDNGLPKTIEYYQKLIS